MKNLLPRFLMYIFVLLFLLLLVLIGCPYCRFFSISCPGCGLTRAWLSFFHGNTDQAFRYNPFFLFAPAFIILYVFRDRAPKQYARPLDTVLFVFAIPMAVYHIFIR